MSSFLNGICLCFGLIFTLIWSNMAYTSHIPKDNHLKSSPNTRLAFPLMNASKGKKAFVDKGCISCHAVNGIGGHDAPSMDVHRKMENVNPFDFAARMWNHASGMIAAQTDAFDKQIHLTGDELANIIAFVHDDEAQHTFGENDLTDKARKMMAHSHSGMPPIKVLMKEVGHADKMPMSMPMMKKIHGHAPGTPEHTD